MRATSLFTTSFLIIALLVKQTFAISCECHNSPPRGGTPGNLILKCDGQATSGDCRCYLNLPQAPTWNNGNAGICNFHQGAAADGTWNVQIVGWKCAQGEDHQTCEYDYTVASTESELMYASF